MRNVDGWIIYRSCEAIGQTNVAEIRLELGGAANAGLCAVGGFPPNAQPTLIWVDSLSRYRERRARSRGGLISRIIQGDFAQSWRIVMILFSRSEVSRPMASRG